MDPNNQGTLPDAGQAQTSIQPNLETPAVPAAQPVADTQPQADFVAQLAAAEQRAQQAELSARHFQSLHDRSAQQIQALAGVQPPQANPLDAFAKKIMDRGLTDDMTQARGLAETMNEFIAPYAQQAQQAQQAAHGNFLLEDVGNKAWASNPQIFGNPQVAQIVQQQLREDVMRGVNVSVEYAVALGKQAYFDTVVSPQPNRPAPVQQAPQFGGFNGPSGGFAQPQAPSKPAPTALQAQWQQDIEKMYPNQ